MPSYFSYESHDLTSHILHPSLFTRIPKSFFRCISFSEATKISFYVLSEFYVLVGALRELNFVPYSIRTRALIQNR